MFTTGVSLDAAVLATWASNPAQSTWPATVWGRRTADMPRIGRP